MNIYYYKNREKILKQRKEYYEKNKDKINERSKLYFKEYYMKNKELSKEEFTKLLKEIKMKILKLLDFYIDYTRRGFIIKNMVSI